MRTVERMDDMAVGTAVDPADDATGSPRRPGSDATLERLRSKILSGELPPGSVVSQLQLARDLGISTTPLREVIRQLQAEGLLVVELNRRPRVAPLDFEDLQGVYAGRILFESLAVALTVPGMTEDDLAALSADLHEMRALAEGDIRLWVEVHNRFHRRLVADAPVAIASTVANFFDRAERYRQPSRTPGRPRRWEAANQEHQRIVEACLAGDPRAAAAELAHHLARTALYLSAEFAPEFDPRAVRAAVSMVTCSWPVAEPRTAAARTRART